jgi:hypothetical protein
MITISSGKLYRLSLNSITPGFSVPPERKRTVYLILAQEKTKAKIGEIFRIGLRTGAAPNIFLISKKI